MYLLAVPVLLEWPDLLKLMTSALRLLTSFYRFFIAVCSAMLSDFLV